LYGAWDRPDEAGRWRKELDALGSAPNTAARPTDR
jgi:hypothetical protein